MKGRILAIAAVLVASVATAAPAFAGSYDKSLYRGATWYAKFQAVSSLPPHYRQREDQRGNRRRTALLGRADLFLLPHQGRQLR
jgi:hypothetical protein